MQLPRFVAAGVCAAMLGAQLWVSFPISKETRGWYWPFLPYPMYAVPHASGDSLVIPELRVATCGKPESATVIAPPSLGLATEEFNLILTTIARAPNAENGRRTSARLARAIDAGFQDEWVAANRARRLCQGDACVVHGAHGGGKGGATAGAVIDFGGSAS